MQCQHKTISILLIVFIVLIFSISGCKDDTVSGKPLNRNPIIFSLAVFPDVISMADSAIVMCNAIDPDGDTLVYDWITDSRLKIKGAFANERSLYHTHENSRIFYPDWITTQIDTPWVQCIVRDVKGGVAAKVITFIVKQE